MHGTYSKSSKLKMKITVSSGIYFGFVLQCILPVVVEACDRLCTQKWGNNFVQFAIMNSRGHYGDLLLEKIREIFPSLAQNIYGLVSYLFM